MADPLPRAVPRLQVVRGDATPEELAALVATLTAIAAARTAAVREPAPSRPSWNARTRMMRGPVRPAAGGWRSSGLP